MFLTRTSSLLVPLIAWTFSSKLFLSAFPEFKSLEDGPVKQKIEDLARKVNFPAKKIYVSEPNLKEPEESMNDVPYVRRETKGEFSEADEQFRFFGRRCVAFGSRVFVVSINRNDEKPLSAAPF